MESNHQETKPTLFRFPFRPEAFCVEEDPPLRNPAYSKRFAGGMIYFQDEAGGWFTQEAPPSQFYMYEDPIEVEDLTPCPKLPPEVETLFKDLDGLEALHGHKLACVGRYGDQIVFCGNSQGAVSLFIAPEALFRGLTGEEVDRLCDLWDHGDVGYYREVNRTWDGIFADRLPYLVQDVFDDDTD